MVPDPWPLASAVTRQRLRPSYQWRHLGMLEQRTFLKVAMKTPHLWNFFPPQLCSISVPRVFCWPVEKHSCSEGPCLWIILPHLRTTGSHDHLCSATDLSTLIGHLIRSDRNPLKRSSCFLPSLLMLQVLSRNQREQQHANPSRDHPSLLPPATLRLFCPRESSCFCFIA